MEIERKFLIKEVPENLSAYSSKEIEQAYLNETPVLRIRKSDDNYILTYKSKGMMIRQEEELPLTKDAYEHLLKKADGHIIQKTRYLIPYDKYTIELDVFKGHMAPLIMAEVEFSSEDEANNFCPPTWFGKDVTYHKEYHNVNMALHQ
ncbi:MAG: CYTH domain-containing protein [Lachnospiraceae bacterium]|nr:CYTH domain-containing protein [Lachnospiraceae bacterium]